MTFRNSWTLWIAGLFAAAALACSGVGPTSTMPPIAPPPSATPSPTVAPAGATAPTAAPTATSEPIPRPVATPASPTPTPSPAATLTPTLTATPTPTPAAGSDAVHGRWEGAVAIGPGQLGFAVTCADSDGSLECKLDIPAQGLSGQGLSRVSFESGRFHFEFDTGFGVAVWEGDLRNDTIEGDFTQAGVSGTFHLERASLAEAPVPEEEPPYRQEEVEFSSGEITLAGTLSLPESAGQHPAVVLISGSGGQTRDSDLYGFPVFKVIADHLTRHGIAALRYDDPGLGDSTGAVLQETIHDRIGNVLAAVGLLLEHAEIDPDRIGLIGHSEGGIVAPLAASRSEDVSVIVLLAGTGVPGEDILRAQLEFLLKDATEEEAERARTQQERLFRVLVSGEGWDEFAEATRQLLIESIEEAPESERATITDVDTYVNTLTEQQLATVQSPWYKSLFEHDPGPVLERLTLPALALFGELDSQVPASMNAPAIAEALTEADNPDFTVFIFPKANHLFQRAVTGSIAEYGDLEKEFVPGFLELIEEWLSTHMDNR